MSLVSASLGKVSALFRAPTDLGSISRPSNWALDLLGGAGPTSAGIAVGPSQALQVSTVYACVRNLCEDVAKLKVGVYEPREGGGRDRLDRHWLTRLLREPNSFQDRFQFFEQIMLSMTLRGNAYIAILRDYRARPVSLVVIRPDRVTILEASDGSLFYQVSRSTTFENALLAGMPLAIPAEDIIHIRLMGQNGLLGLSPIAQARETMGLALVAEKHQAKLLSNGARPGGVLKHPKTISEAARARLANNWNNAQGGLDNVGKTALLEEGLTWEALGMTSVDAEFMAGRKFSVEEICRWFRMPPHMVGHLERSTNNNIAVQGTEYLTHTLSPYLERIEAAFDRGLELNRLGLFIEFETYGLTRGDALTAARTDEIQRRGGWLTANEARMRRGLNPMPGGDELGQQNMPGQAGRPEGSTGVPGDIADPENEGTSD